MKMRVHGQNTHLHFTWDVNAATNEDACSWTERGGEIYANESFTPLVQRIIPKAHAAGQSAPAPGGQGEEYIDVYSELPFETQGFTIECPSESGVGGTSDSDRVTVTINNTDFELIARPDVIQMPTRGNSEETTISIDASSQFTADVVLTAEAVPLDGKGTTAEGFEFVFTPSTLTSRDYEAGSRLYVRADERMPRGDYNLIVTGTSQEADGSTRIRTGLLTLQVRNFTNDNEIEEQ